MDAFILLADAATDHPDGTFSLLRAWIDNVFAAGEPVFFRGALVARIKASVNEAGKHDFAVKCSNFDGGSIMEPIQGGFVVPEEGGGSQFVVNFGIRLPKFGKYVFALLINNKEKDTWTITATKVADAAQGEQP